MHREIPSAIAPRSAALSTALLVVGILFVFPGHGLTQVPLIQPGGMWRYLDDGSDQGKTWRQLEFDDREWLAGRGQFGYGQGDETTLIHSGPPGEEFVTTYFRHVFLVPAPLPNARLELVLLWDDAVAVYLNGVPVFSDNLPNLFRFDTSAIAEKPDDGLFFSTIPINSAFLMPGPNVLAVEVHQVSGRFPRDMSFDAALMLVQPEPPLIEQDPQCITAFLGTNVQFFAFAVGAERLQWLHNDVPIPGETNFVLTLNKLGRQHVGQYRLRAENPAGIALSGPGQLQLELDSEGAIRNDLVARDYLSLSGTGPAFAFAAAAGPGGCQPPVFSLSHGSSYSYSTHGAGSAPGETNHCGVAGGHSMWSIFFATVTERVIIRTEGSDFDTVLAVYTWDGDDTHPLVPVVCDNDSGPDHTSRVEFLAVAGTTYYIAVDGVNGATGNVRLQIGGLELGAPSASESGLLQMSLKGRRAQERTYTLQCSTNPAASSNGWITVLTTNVARTVESWAFHYRTNVPAGTPKLFYNGKEQP